MLLGYYLIRIKAIGACRLRKIQQFGVLSYTEESDSEVPFPPQKLPSYQEKLDNDNTVSLIESPVNTSKIIISALSDVHTEQFGRHLLAQRKSEKLLRYRSVFVHAHVNNDSCSRSQVLSWLQLD